MRAIAASLLLLTTALAPGCQASPGPAAAQAKETARAGGDGADPGEGGVTIHVLSNGWHTGIVLARADLPAGTLAETDDFPAATHLIFEWGDAVYFPAREKGLGMTLRAALTPTPAVVHLVGLRAHPRQVFPDAETVAVRLSPEGFRKLVDYLDGAFARDGGERAAASAPGLYSDSRFYPATGSFHLFNTCNTWTARGLAVAGRPVEAARVVRAEDVMVQLRGKRQRAR